MKKRRRLADKMTIIVSAVLVAVSVFFYAPMDVSAMSGNSVSPVPLSDSGFSSDYFNLTPDIMSGYYVAPFQVVDDTSFDFSPYLSEGVGLYEVFFDVTVHMSDDGTRAPKWFNSVFYHDVSGFNYQISKPTSQWYLHNFDWGYSNHKVIIDSSVGTEMLFGYGSVLLFDAPVSSMQISCSFDLSNIRVNKLTSSDSDEYQSGYNAGFSAGEQAGYGNGYSNGFADGEASVDTDAIYDEAFQAGKDSVDTESYYDAGYQAGYQVAYQEGYESGYDEGYQSAMDRINGWGADSSDYPILKYSFFKDRLRLICDVFTSAPSTSYDSSLLCYLDFDINPNHTYKFSVNTGGASGGTSDALYSDFELNFVIGSNTINAHNNIGNTFDFYIPGYNMGSSILLEAFVYDCVYYGGSTEEDGFLKHMGQVYPTLIDCYIDIYDMGPSGDTQNHIANQTDKLTNGFNDSKGNSVNNDFSAGLNDFETAEDSLFATATIGLKDFAFFDFQSVPAMVTGMSFVGSIMSGWFTQAGGASGVGIVLSILFSIMLVAMVLGLYRWYQSKGGKD